MTQIIRNFIAFILLFPLQSLAYEDGLEILPKSKLDQVADLACECTESLNAPSKLWVVLFLGIAFLCAKYLPWRRNGMMHNHQYTLFD